MTTVHIKGSYTIKPSEPTREGVFPLSELDQTGVITHIPTIYFYKPFKDKFTSSNSMIDTLKESLSRVLVHFYHLAGRVRWIGQGRLELLCNAMGAELVEAESSSQLSDFEDFASHTWQFKDLVPFVDYDKPIDELPLMLAQLTLFRCGGVSVGITISHIVVDGQCAFHFITEWARLARGEPLEAIPYHDYEILRASEPSRESLLGLRGLNIITNKENKEEFNRPPLLIGRDNNLEERKKATTMSLLPLTREFVEGLKKFANKDMDISKARPYSRYEVITAHIWRSACKARKHEYEQLTCLGFSVDVRHRLHPPIPQTYFGNAILDVVASAKAGDIMKRPLSYTCGRIREVIEKMNDEYVWSYIEFLRNQPDLSMYQDLHGRKSDDGPFYGNPNIGVISWLRLPIYGLDFGWGNEIYMGPGTHDTDGGCLLLPGPVNDGSVKIALCFQVGHMDTFKKYFFEDVSSFMSSFSP